MTRGANFLLHELGFSCISSQVDCNVVHPTPLFHSALSYLCNCMNLHVFLNRLIMFLRGGILTDLSESLSSPTEKLTCS